MIDFAPIAGGEQRRSADIIPDRLSSDRQRRAFRHFAGETGLPLARFMHNTNGLDLALNGAMPAHRDAPNPEQLQPSPVQFHARTELFEREPMKVMTAFEARIARFLLTSLHPAKEGLKRLVHIIAHALYRLTKDDLRLRERLAIDNPGFFLLRLANTSPLKCVCPLPLGKAQIVPVAAHVQHLEQALLLCLAWVLAVFEGAKYRLLALLCIDIPTNGLLRHVSGGRYKVAACPKRRQFQKMWILLAEHMRGESVFWKRNVPLDWMYTPEHQRDHDEVDHAFAHCR